MNIGLKIRELRKRKGITQERLAEYLNISPQAVSKWESGMSLPDITYVPKLVSFFGVSADELLSINKDMADKRVQYYRSEYESLKKLFDTDGCIRLMEQALSEMPSNYEFMLNVVFDLSVGDRPRNPERIIELCERIVEDCTDDNLRFPAIERLCKWYPKVGRRAEAIALIDNLPDMMIEKEFWREYALEGNEKTAQKQKNLISVIDYTVSRLIHLSSDEHMGKSLTMEEKIEFSEVALKIYNAIFYKGHKAGSSGSFRHIYERISELYLGMGDKENGIKYLHLAAEAAEYYDKTMDSNKNYYPIFIRNVKCNHSERDYLDTVRLLQLMDMREAFDIIRDTDDFKDIHSHLESLSPNNELV